MISGQRAAGSGQRAAGSGQRAAGSGQRAAGSGQRAAGNVESLNRTVFISDNLPFLRALDTESIDLVVIDPPFGKNQTFEGNLKPPLTNEELEVEFNLLSDWGVQNEDDAYDAGLEFPDQTGTTAKFGDIWSFKAQVTQEQWNRIGEQCPEALRLIEATRYTHSESIAAYITFMTIRIIEIRRILKLTGSVYLHCDHEANAYLRQMMDAVFGQRNFRNEITWVRHTSQQRGSQHMPRKFANVTDTILFYSKTEQASVAAFISLDDEDREKKFDKVDENGERYYDDSAHIWSSPNMDPRPNLCYEWRGFVNPHPSGWRLSKERMEEEYQKGNFVILPSGRLQRRKYERDWRGATRPNLWTDIEPLSGSSKERSGYDTQKPQALARRIIEASSNPGDVVLDCFAGCAYVPVAAEQTGRNWLACDMSPRAWTVVKRQFAKQEDMKIVAKDGNVFGQPRMGDERVIQVRGPNELPERTTPDEPRRRRSARELPPLEFRQRAVEKSQVIWEAFVSEWGTRCWFCGTEKARDRRELELDHIEPNKRDGTNDDCWNRALACAPCNSDKDNKYTVEETVDMALAAGRIQTPALRDEQLTIFKQRHEWAKARWNRVKLASSAQNDLFSVG